MSVDWHMDFNPTERFAAPGVIRPRVTPSYVNAEGPDVATTMPVEAPAAQETQVATTLPDTTATASAAPPADVIQRPLNPPAPCGFKSRHFMTGMIVILVTGIAVVAILKK